MNKRSHIRRDYVARVKVHYQNIAGESIQMDGMVEDKSVGGMLIRVRENISLGLVLVIRSPQGEQKAIVRRSTRAEMGYLVGVEFLGDEGVQKPPSDLPV